MKKLLTAFALLMLNCGWLMAQNPIIRDQFTADPTARVFNNKVYLYPSHDIVHDCHPKQSALGKAQLLFHVGT